MRMNATINAAARRRNQVVILNGLRPGAKLQTSKPARRLSHDARFALSMAWIGIFGGIAWGMMLTYSELGSRTYALAGLAAMLIAMLPLIVKEKGGEK